MPATMSATGVFGVLGVRARGNIAFWGYGEGRVTDGPYGTATKVVDGRGGMIEEVDVSVPPIGVGSDCTTLAMIDSFHTSMTSIDFDC